MPDKVEVHIKSSFLYALIDCQFMTPLRTVDNRFYRMLVLFPKAYYVFLDNTGQYEIGSLEYNGTATSILVPLQDINPGMQYLKN